MTRCKESYRQFEAVVAQQQFPGLHILKNRQTGNRFVHLLTNHQINYKEQGSPGILARCLTDSRHTILKINQRYQVKRLTLESTWMDMNFCRWIQRRPANIYFKRMFLLVAALACGSAGRPSLSWAGLGCTPLCTHAASLQAHWTSLGQPICSNKKRRVVRKLS